MTVQIKTKHFMMDVESDQDIKDFESEIRELNRQKRAAIEELDKQRRLEFSELLEEQYKAWLDGADLESFVQNPEVSEHKNNFDFE